MQLERQLKLHRSEHELTQEELAKKLNVSRSTISNWENGRSQPDLESLLSLSDLFEISVDRLLRGDQKMTEKINRDIKKGRNLKKLLLVSLAPLVVIIIALSWIFYSKESLANVSLDEVYDVTVPTESELTSESQLEGLAKLDKFESVEFATFTEVEDTLYLEVLKRKKLTGMKHEFTIKLADIYRPERITKIVLFEGTGSSSEGLGKSDFEKGIGQRVLWEKKK